MLTPPTAFPICTIANTPRLPEHCIEWASVLEWPKDFRGRSWAVTSALLAYDILRWSDKKLDTDDPDHIEWLYQKALSRAAEFKIEGVTWALTQGVVKHIIPAIASTNAIIAGKRSPSGTSAECISSASCCNEAFKLSTICAPSLDNYMMVSITVTGYVGPADFGGSVYR
jgi:ubiquitin-activating enzyme E1 C